MLVNLYSQTYKCDKKFDRYTAMIIVQNLRDFGWKYTGNFTQFLSMYLNISLHLDVFPPSLACTLEFSVVDTVGSRWCG